VNVIKVNQWKDTCIATTCKHYFHIECFKEYITKKEKCPTCGFDLKKASISSKEEKNNKKIVKAAAVI